jgi:hypothetical protein
MCVWCFIIVKLHNGIRYQIWSNRKTSSYGSRFKFDRKMLIIYIYSYMFSKYLVGKIYFIKVSFNLRVKDWIKIGDFATYYWKFVKFRTEFYFNKNTKQNVFRSESKNVFYCIIPIIFIVTAYIFHEFCYLLCLIFDKND